jgi:hypothetical protein
MMFVLVSTSTAMASGCLSEVEFLVPILFLILLCILIYIFMLKSIDLSLIVCFNVPHAILVHCYIEQYSTVSQANNGYFASSALLLICSYFNWRFFYLVAVVLQYTQHTNNTPRLQLGNLHVRVFVQCPFVTLTLRIQRLNAMLE